MVRFYNHIHEELNKIAEFDAIRCGRRFKHYGDIMNSYNSTRIHIEIYKLDNYYNYNITLFKQDKSTKLHYNKLSQVLIFLKDYFTCVIT